MPDLPSAIAATWREQSVAAGQSPWPRVDVVDLVTRAHRLGYCRRRVATALGASDAERAAIEARCTTPDDIARATEHGGGAHAGDSSAER